MATQQDPDAHFPGRSSSLVHSQRVDASPESRRGEVKSADFGFLLQPEIYHPLSAVDVPSAFQDVHESVDPSSSADELLKAGFFRAAAIAAVQELTGTGSNGSLSPYDADRIFGLLYVRLASLTLINATALAAQEVKALEDFSNPAVYVDEATGEHVAPWELRVLNVRLQSLGFEDPRRAVISYHDLAREARTFAKAAAAKRDTSALRMWRGRLHDLGIKVAGALIEMDDFSGAAVHLDSLQDQSDGKLMLSKALLWLHLGDAERARRCALGSTGDIETGSYKDKIILALCDMADADFEAALDKWQALLRSSNEDEMLRVNMAVCLLYLGRMQEGREVLESLVDAGFSSHTLLFNLTTIYELCTERNRSLKLKLANRVAENPAFSTGREVQCRLQIMRRP